MTLAGLLKEQLTRIRNNLSHVSEKERLSTVSIIMIIVLDLFILYAIFRGLDEHTSQLTSPDEYIPETCRDIVFQEDRGNNNRLDSLTSLLLSIRDDDLSGDDVDREKKAITLHPVCEECAGRLEKLKKDRQLIILARTRDNLGDELSDLKESIDDLKGSYDSYVLQNIAGKPGLKESDVARIRQELNDTTARYNLALAQYAAINTKINDSAVVTDYFRAVANLQRESKDSLKADLRSLEFWFPARRLLMQMAFLVPLLLIFYVWNSRSIKRSSSLQTLISSHLLVVASIPILMKMIEALYDIIPRTLLKKIWDLLVSLNLVAVWHYMIIFLSILASIIIIYFVQKKLFNREKLAQRRLSKGNCVECGKKLPRECSACPFCGYRQVAPCPACNTPTFVNGKFCREYGAPVTAVRELPG